MHRPLPPFVLSAITMVCAIWLFPQSPLEAEPPQPSNVVFILTDNQGAWTLGCYGNPDIRTPRIDRMAKEGVRFERAFSSNAVCSPTRATYLTGLLPSQHGVHNFLGGSDGLQVGPEQRNTLAHVTSLAEILKKNGYACGLVGKWHLGNNTQPNEGFDDYWITLPVGSTSTFRDAEIIENGKLRKEPTHLTEFWTKHALKFLDQTQGKPFFLYLAYNGPYGLSRLQLKPSGNRWTEIYAKEPLPSFPRGVIDPSQYNNREYFGDLTAIRRYAEEVSAVDDGVGAVLDKLKALGVDQNTLVVFAADQGWAGGQHGIWGMGDHTRPVNALEHSMRVPLIFRQPGRIEADRVESRMVSNYDFLPTVLDLLDLEEQWPERKRSPGRSYAGALTSENAATASGWTNEVFYEYEELRCIRTEDWKYVERFGPGHDELYHLTEDPGERQNLLADSRTEVVARKGALQERLTAFFSQHAEPAHDLWKGGTSQPHTLVWGRATSTGPTKPTTSKPVPVPLPAIDPDWHPPAVELPPGLIAEVAAAPPLVKHPVMATFDDQGRLFVAENAGLNLTKEELLKQQPNSIVRLTDLNNDGLYDEKTVFADGLTFPQGVLWAQGSLFVMSPPSLWRFEDENDDGVAETREELVTGFDFTGNAADVHGPFLHPNGRIYWCHGRKGHSVHDPRSGALVSEAKGARIWSCRPDGSDVQVFAGGGMDNPVELDFSDEGEVLGTVNLFHGRPRGDVLVHWIWGGVYPRADQTGVLSEFPRSGPLLSEIHNFGHVAVSGMTRYRTGRLSEAWRNNLLVAHFNTQKVTRTVIQPAGSTYEAGLTETIFRVEQRDAHLTDVLEDPNGDLLVVDTGGWFRIGCPTSQTAKPEIPGAIYRIRPSGLPHRNEDAFGVSDDWTKLNEEALADRFGSPSAAVREKAMTELAIRGEPSLGVLEALVTDQEIRPSIRLCALFTLARMDFTEATLQVAKALDDSHPEVRQAACNALLANRSREALASHDPKEAKFERQLNRDLETKLMALCRDGRFPAVQRSAAALLGRIGTGRAAGALLGVAGREASDGFLRHAVTYALIQIADPEAVRAGLEPGNALRQKAALRALDQMPNSTLDVLTLLPFLESADPQLRETAVEIVPNHPDWDAALANRFRDWLDAGHLASETTHLAILEQVAPHFLSTPPMPALLTQMLGTGEASLVASVYRSLLASPEALTAAPEWIVPIRETLSGPSDAPLLLPALQVVGRFRDTTPFSEQLKAIAADVSRPALQRVHALRAGGARKGIALPEESWKLLLGLIDSAQEASQRLEACRLLGEARLTPAQLTLLAARTSLAGPLELPVLLPAFSESTDPAVGDALAAALPKSPGLGNVPPEELERLAGRFPATTMRKFLPVIDRLRRSGMEREARLASLEPELNRGDATRGRVVYESGKGACITCHRVGDLGRAIGPDLTTIGQIRTRRDLLESILYPSESFARDFEPYVIRLTSGSPLLGLIQRETATAVHLVNAAGEEVSLPRQSISAIEPSPVSLMPAGLDQALSKEELLDLVAFLKSLGSAPH
ncbi:MAG: sulfatase-like hydrolase/transferase [Akkermansiaceae bacterium]|nr:sulfatase-like hydrolase/transferase [Akkermansiaceae bacterium]